ncbi:hypothetical protein GCM10025869_08830 [Homoserinibacter gongjuensis]|uniref:Uncharacterized protein n=1 Tax=Homoserinibacter gongjuensis TaxID=1162968 RepID=A0ABQ6JSR3_9MICO|nr:hypothetical protein GCM10025869_08830 [Homoserinibacter gongjuensis]
MMTAPPSRAPTCSPTIVTTGIEEFRTTCPKSTCRGVSPFEIAVCTYPSAIDSATLLRVIRVMTAMNGMASVTAGSTRWAGLPVPALGSTCSWRAKNRMNMMPIQNGGAAWSVSANPEIARSSLLPGREPAIAPSRSPMVATTVAARASSAVAGSRSNTSSIAGRPKR